MIEVSKNSASIMVLIVEDDEVKLDKVRSLLIGISNAINILVAKDQIGAQKILLTEKADLMILDMQLPNRIGDFELQKDGGENILGDLFTDDKYKMPTNIIALTEFDGLQEQLRMNFPDVAVIKYSSDSDKWKEFISRKVTSCLKSKKDQRIILYCEGLDADLYNLMGLPNIEFRGLKDSRAIYLAAKNEKDKYALRDRDFLSTKEIKKLKELHRNYFILEYYCLENYLYHPDNISEVIKHFDREAYINDIQSQKKAKLLAIIQDYKLSRNSYLDLTDQNTPLDESPDHEILASLEAESLDDFYKFFDMAGKKDTSGKKSYNKTFLSKYSLDKTTLAQSSWIKENVKWLVGFT